MSKEVTKMDCQWGEWMDQPCTATCGIFAIKLRTRSKIQKDVSGGVDCTGSSVSIESCDHRKCPGRLNKYDFYFCSNQNWKDILVDY